MWHNNILKHILQNRYFIYLSQFSSNFYLEFTLAIFPVLCQSSTFFFYARSMLSETENSSLPAR